MIWFRAICDCSWLFWLSAVFCLGLRLWFLRCFDVDFCWWILICCCLVIFVCVDFCACIKSVLLPLVARHWVVGNLRAWIFLLARCLLLYRVMFACGDFFLLLFLGAVYSVLRSLYAWIVLLLVAQHLFSARSVAWRSRLSVSVFLVPALRRLSYACPAVWQCSHLDRGAWSSWMHIILQSPGALGRRANLFLIFVCVFVCLAGYFGWAFLLLALGWLICGSCLFCAGLSLRYCLIWWVCWAIFIYEIYALLCGVTSMCVVLFCDGRSCNDWRAFPCFFVL